RRRSRPLRGDDPVLARGARPHDRVRHLPLRRYAARAGAAQHPPVRGARDPRPRARRGTRAAPLATWLPCRWPSQHCPVPGVLTGRAHWREQSPFVVAARTMTAATEASYREETFMPRFLLLVVLVVGVVGRDPALAHADTLSEAGTGTFTAPGRSFVFSGTV